MERRRSRHGSRHGTSREGAFVEVRCKTHTHAYTRTHIHTRIYTHTQTQTQTHVKLVPVVVVVVVVVVFVVNHLLEFFVLISKKGFNDATGNRPKQRKAFTHEPMNP
jgi:hypothetical protein